jgi:hypothetical protein
MVIQLRFWADNYGAVEVTYYGPNATYVMTVPGTDEGDQPFWSEINWTIGCLVGVIAPQDGGEF